MQAQDGQLVGLSRKQFDAFIEHGSTNVATVGDVFKVRGCFFEVEHISEYGISAKGISRREYLAKKNKGQLRRVTPQDGHMI